MPTIRAIYGNSGPLIDVYVGVSEPARLALKAAGRDIPPPVSCPFIIDTGADSSMVSEQALRGLGLQARGSRRIITATSTETCDTFDVSLQLRSVGDPGFRVAALEIIGRSLVNLPIDGILGRDFLDRIELRIDGPARRYAIMWA